MARKGDTLWVLSRETRTDNGIDVTQYARRSDGKLLSRFAIKNLDGSARHDYGWKLAQGNVTRMPAPYGRLLRLGFELASGTAPQVRDGKEVIVKARKATRAQNELGAGFTHGRFR